MMASVGLLPVLALLMCFEVASSSNADRTRLLNDLNKGVNPDVLPRGRNASTPVKVTLNIDLVKILDVDKDKNEVEVVIWQQTGWENMAYAWNPSLYGNITSINLPLRYMWAPDIMLVNSVKAPEVLSPQLAVLQYDGSVNYVPSVRLRFAWNDIRGVESASGMNFTMKMMSWTLNSQQYSLAEPDTSRDYKVLYIDHPRYSLLGASAEKEVKAYGKYAIYEACLFTFTIRERHANAAPGLLTQNPLLPSVLIFVASITLGVV